MDSEFLVRVLGALFAIMNPFVNLPIFLSLTEDNTAAETRRIAIATFLYSTIMCVVIVFAGDPILNFFGISIDDFKLAGGLVLLLIALGMLNGHDSTAHRGTAKEREQSLKVDNIAFYPMTFPIIVGPGTIATLLLFLGQAQSTKQYASIALALAVVLCLLGIVLFFSGAIGQVMSQTLRVIMTRLMGMILAAISIEMITGGLKALLPGLA